MTLKVVRGQLLTFIAEPKDYLGSAVTPDTLVLYVNYPHGPDGETSTDTISMDPHSDGTWTAEFDTSDSEPGAAFVSLRATNPTGAEDLKFTIVANAANPEPST